MSDAEEVVIDRKYSIRGGEIVNVDTGLRLNIGEPRILFRGRDELVIPMLYSYIKMAKERGCDLRFIRQLEDIAEDFEAYRALAPDAMKLPD